MPIVGRTKRPERVVEVVEKPVERIVYVPAKEPVEAPQEEPAAVEEPRGWWTRFLRKLGIGDNS